MSEGGAGRSGEVQLQHNMELVREEVISHLESWIFFKFVTERMCVLVCTRLRDTHAIHQI